MFTYKISALGRRSTRRKGAAVVELVVTLPVFLIFLFNIIQYGYTMNAFVTLSNVARDTARYAAVHGTPDGACYDVKHYGEATIGPAEQMGTGTITVTPQYLNGSAWTDLSACTTGATGSNSKWTAKTPARIKVAYNFATRNLHLPFVWLPTNLNSSQNAYATMYVEPQQ